jgi:hypothetical protein
VLRIGRSDGMTLLAFCLSLVLAMVHLLIGRFRKLRDRPRNLWLSCAAGVAVAYVFLHILPDLAAHQRAVAGDLTVAPKLAEIGVFAISLAGLTIFYGLERLATWSRRRSCAAGGDDDVGAAVFWAHIGSFALYNLLIGYLLVRGDTSEPGPMLVFAVAMALHFVTNDFSLRQHHKHRYDVVGRWVVAGAVLAGWLLGVAARLPDLGIAVLFALLAGGVVLNVLKEELPAERDGRFLPFLLGAVGYAVVMLAVDQM